MGILHYREPEFVTVVAEGALGLDEIRKCFEEVRSLYEPSSDVRILIVDNLSDFNPTQEVVRELVSFWSHLFAEVRVRIALYVQKESHFGIGRMAMALGEKYQLPFRVFRERSEALEWLKLPPNPS